MEDQIWLLVGVGDCERVWFLVGMGKATEWLLVGVVGGVAGGRCDGWVVEWELQNQVWRGWFLLGLVVEWGLQNQWCGGWFLLGMK